MEPRDPGGWHGGSGVWWVASKSLDLGAAPPRRRIRQPQPARHRAALRPGVRRQASSRGAGHVRGWGGGRRAVCCRAAASRRCLFSPFSRSTARSSASSLSDVPCSRHGRLSQPFAAETGAPRMARLRAMTPSDLVPPWVRWPSRVGVALTVAGMAWALTHLELSPAAKVMVAFSTSCLVASLTAAEVVALRVSAAPEPAWTPPISTGRTRCAQTIWSAAISNPCRLRASW